MDPPMRYSRLPNGIAVFTTEKNAVKIVISYANDTKKETLICTNNLGVAKALPILTTFKRYQLLTKLFSFSQTSNSKISQTFATITTSAGQITFLSQAF